MMTDVEEFIYSRKVTHVANTNLADMKLPELRELKRNEIARHFYYA